jgi:hypothetical protein
MVAMVWKIYQFFPPLLDDLFSPPYERLAVQTMREQMTMAIFSNYIKLDIQYYIAFVI